MATLTGKTIGGYEILEEVGRGAMGVVFKARQVSMDRIVALKFLPKRMAQNQKLVQRFVREARAAGKLSHPNIVAVHDVGQIEGMHYISMEFVDGTTCFKQLKERGAFGEEQALEIGMQIAGALKEAHGRGILHRDVKPDNFLLDRSGRARLADLGLARIEDGGTSDDGHLTQDGSALGTPHYMSPEQAKGESCDARSDLYGLGASLYTMVTGKTLFEGQTAAAIMVQVIQEPHKPLKQLCPGLSPSFCAVAEKLLQKDPAKRFQNAGEVLEALGKAKAGEYVAGPGGTTRNAAKVAPGARRVRERTVAPVSRPAQAGSPAVYAGIGIAAAVVVLLGLSVLRGGGSPPARSPSNESQVAAAERNAAVQATPRSNDASSPVPRKPAADPAQAAFDELAKRHELELGSNPSALAAAWDEYLARFPNAPQAGEARRKAIQARESLLKLDAAWTQAEADAEKALAEDRPREAAERLREFLQAHATSPLAERARAKLEGLRSMLHERLRGEIDKALAAAESGDFAAAREKLDRLKDRVPAHASDETGLREAYAKLEEFEGDAARKAGAAASADTELLEAAFVRAHNTVLGAEVRFGFADAARAFSSLTAKVSSASGKDQAKVWAEAYTRAGRVWSAMGEAIRAGKSPEVDAFGRYGKGQLSGWSERGADYQPEGLSQPQLVTWRSVEPAQAWQLFDKLNLSGGLRSESLDAGLFACALERWAPAARLLKTALENPQDKALAEPAYRRALEMLNREALKALVAAEQAKGDPKTLREVLAPLREGGELAETAAAQENRAKIEELLKGPPEPEPQPVAADTPKAANAAPAEPAKPDAETLALLQRAGWRDAGGAWQAVEGKPGVFAVKDGTLTAETADANVSVSFQLKPGAKVEVLVRYREGEILKVRDGIERLRQFNREVADNLGERMKDINEGYGTLVEAGRALAYTTPPQQDEGGRGPGGRGRGPGRGGRWTPPWLSDLASLPTRTETWEAGGDAHTVEVKVKDNNLFIKVDNFTRSDANPLRADGKILIRVTGEATLSQPRVQR